MPELPSRRTQQEIADLAQDFVSNRVYSIEDVPEELIPVVFMPLAMDNPFSEFTQEQIRQLFVFAVYGKDRCAEMAVNGYPIFFSFQLWHRDDAIQAFERASAAARFLSGEQPSPANPTV